VTERECECGWKVRGEAKGEQSLSIFFLTRRGQSKGWVVARARGRSRSVRKTVVRADLFFAQPF